MLQENGQCLGSIPHDEIMIKVGGDMGQKVMKFTLQICNVEKPNSPLNTLVITSFEAKDTYMNMAVALDGISQQLEQLDESEWTHNGVKRKIKLSGSGDYEFIAKATGISGASATYPCVYCRIDKNEMQKPSSERSQSDRRTKESLDSHYMAFLTESLCDNKKQSHHFNVINPPLLHLEPRKYSIPWLHILLGLVKGFHDKLEASCEELDLKIKLDKHYEDTKNDKKSLSKLQKNHSKMVSKISIIEETQDSMPLQERKKHDAELRIMEEKIQQIESDMSSLSDKISESQTVNWNDEKLLLLELNKTENELFREMKVIEDICEEDITLAELRGRKKRT